MKKLVGGDYLLDLTPIEIEESVDGTTKTNITNKEIIEQLTNLKKFVSNPSMIKPVWVEFINGETDEIIVVRGEFKVVDANEFEICASINGYKLQLFIEFTQAELSDHTPIDDWYINTNDAKYLFTSDAQNVKAIIEDADFGNVALAGGLSIGGDASVTGDLSVTGKVNGKIAFEDIEDADGHKRFVDFDFTPETISNVTWTYAKASLSGTHLLIVLAGTIANGSGEISAGVLAYVGLPEWIRNKIYPAYEDYIGQFKGQVITKTTYATTDHTFSMDKTDDGIRLDLSNAIALDSTNERVFRVAYDLLIDNN